MLLNADFNIAKGAGSLFLLLTWSIAVQAGDPETDIRLNEATDETSIRGDNRHRFHFPDWSEERPPFPERGSRLNNETFANEGAQLTYDFPEWPEDRPALPERRPRLNDEASASEQNQRGFNFPRWPERRMSPSRERIPLAPPGPYMSSALSDFSFNESETSFENDMDGRRRELISNSPGIPIERFSPDIPWPSHTKSPDRWQPENGYRYADHETRVNSQPYPEMPYNYGYDRPRMNWSDREGRSQ
jgi:hypothetical protein